MAAVHTRAEQAAVRAAGIKWRDYDAYVKQMGDERRLTKVPADLHTKPYRDEHDYDLLRRMEARVGSRKVPRSRTRWAAAEPLSRYSGGFTKRGGSASTTLNSE